MIGVSSIMSYFKNRKVKKNAKEALRHARTLRNLRGDLMTNEELDILAKAENELKSALKAGDIKEINRMGDNLIDVANNYIPERNHSSLFENLEVVLVAVIVAMGVRAYFLQPYKIPTGSMQPTLKGITSQTTDKPRFQDRIPLKYIYWALFGEWYKNVRVRITGVVDSITEADRTLNPSIAYFVVEGKSGKKGEEGETVRYKYKLPRDAGPFKDGRDEYRFEEREYIKKGESVWSGITIAGDHVFVDKFSWNFRKPRRGEIMVFKTDGIANIEPNFYIKRIIGLPGDKVSINPPNVLINGKELREPESIRKIVDMEGAYEGYTYTGTFQGEIDEVIVPKGEYFVLGDNSESSLDSRYWGTVPQQNAIGVAMFIYWPFSQRWGLID